MFEGFDFNILNDPEFKEDAVREELIFPILSELGYSATGTNRIIRSKNLIHPFVMIGSKKRAINIVPDYLLLSEGKNAFILDAKSPTEKVYESTNVEQVYSYAIHPDIRVTLYALCNGIEFVIYDIFQFEPLLRFKLSEINEHWIKLQNILSPNAIQNPEMRDFLPDFGVLAHKAGYPTGMRWSFLNVEVAFVMKVNDGLYTTYSYIDSGVEAATTHIISLDFTQPIFEELLKYAPVKARAEIKSALSRQPYRADIESPFNVNIQAYMGEWQTGEHDSFIPFDICKISLPKI